MTSYVLMSGQTVPSNQPNAPASAQVVLPAATRGRVTFSLSAPTTLYAEASLWAQTAATPYGYTQDIPLLVLAIPAGQRAVAQELAFDLAYYDFLFARLDTIDRSQSVGASMTVDV